MALLQFDKLVCTRGGRSIFAPVSGSVAPGEALLVSGANGSGKSSLLRLIAGLNIPSSGMLKHAGDYAFMGHDTALKSAFTVQEELFFWCNLKGAPDKIESALSAMALTDLRSAPCRLLSSGQKRRTALARILCSGAPLWILDEPTVGLDSASRALLEAALAHHRSGGGGLVIASHDELHLPGAKALRL
jgi:heme exporter protein A